MLVGVESSRVVFARCWWHDRPPVGVGHGGFSEFSTCVSVDGDLVEVFAFVSLGKTRVSNYKLSLDADNVFLCWEEDRRGSQDAR